MSILLLAASAFLAQAQSSSGPVFEEIRFHRVHLKNGNFIDGQLLSDGEKEVSLKLKIGEISLRRELVDRIEFVKIRKIAEPPEKTPHPRTPPATVPSPDPTKPRPPQTPRDPNPPAAVVTANVPPEIRKKVDAILSMENLAISREDREALSQRLVALGREALPYLNAIVAQRKGDAPVDLICPVIAEFRDPGSIASLMELMKAEEPTQRTPAVKALAAMQVAECVGPLIEALDDGWLEIPRAAASGLTEIHRKLPRLDIPRLLTARLPKARGKGFIGNTLGLIGDEEARRLLCGLLRERNEEIAVAALQGLSLCATADEGPALQEALKSDLRGAVQGTCVIVARLKFKAATPELIELLRKEDEGLISSAHAALKALSGEGFSNDPATWQNWWENVGSKQP
jgi:HEAT repeat protein